jgi:catechol 2,3-dioxygenase-like lactoylglutathione lyase family enzyme
MTSDVTGANARPIKDRSSTTTIKEASMSGTQLDSDGTRDTPGPATVALKLEVAVLPVADVDRAKAFYERLGWRLDANVTIDEHYRVVQFTPPGSAASIIFGHGTTNMAPGSVQDLMLVVEDLDAARDELIARGADVSEIWHDETGIFHHGGTEARVSGRDPKGRSYGSWASFSDPDGNGWLLQEITERLPGRE